MEPGPLEPPPFLWKEEGGGRKEGIREEMDDVEARPFLCIF